MGIIYQPNDTGNTAGAGWTCPYCNQLVGFGQPHACEVSDKPPTTEQLIAEIEWLRAEVERLRAALTRINVLADPYRESEAWASPEAYSRWAESLVGLL